ncbi:MAG: HEAT repeat domain-containing protein [Candidatus Thorarchaeota archaeon]
MTLKQLKGELKSKDKNVRAQAVDKIAMLQDQSTVKDLIEILLNDKEGMVRRRAALALGRIETDEASDALYLAIEKDEDYETRRSAAIALGKFGDERAILPLYQFYSKPKASSFFESIDRARVNIVLTELAQRKGMATIEQLVDWKKNKDSK